MIELQKVTKKFGEHILFEDFDLMIENGEFVVFAGESGCGKTTLLNMIGGVEPLDSGEILVDGNNLKNKKYLKEYYMYKVGFLFQNFALIENKSVKQNLELVQKKSRTNYTVEEVLEKVGLSDKKEYKVYKLSGGEQQRVALARLMYKQCDILLADEPTGSLDSRNAAQVMQLLEDLHQEGKTIVLVTHNEEIIKNSERVIYL